MVYMYNHKFSINITCEQLRGLTSKQARIDAECLLHKLKLSCKKDEYGCYLSGGMKRRLCLGNALIGNTK